MKFLILFFLFSTHSFARDCLRESYNYELGDKLLGIVTDMVESDPFKNLERECKDPDRNEMWKDEVAAVEKSFKKDAAILSSGRPIFDSHAGNLYNEEICERLDKKLKDRSNCYYPEEMLKELKDSDVFRMKLEDACLKLGKKIKAARHTCNK